MIEKEYAKAQSIDDYYSYLNDLKQKILLRIHLQYKESEVIGYLDQLSVEKEIKEIIMIFFKQIVVEGKKRLVDEKDENKLIRLWYEQYMDFGVINGYNHYADLIIFDFQKKEIENLIKRFKMFMNEATLKLIEELLEKLYTNTYKSFIKFLLDYYKCFGVKFYKKKDAQKREIISSYVFPKPENHVYGDFIDQKIRSRPIVKFISYLRSIALGGQFNDEKKLYVPFFMGNEKRNSDVKKFLTSRLNQVIKTYYPHLLKPLVFPKELLYANRYLNLPLINLGIFKEINWDFMPEAYFYDGVAVKREEKNKEIFYAIYTHPLSLFYSFFNIEDFEVFIDQLLHHEFIHIQQYRYIFIHDKLLTNKDWVSQHQKEAMLIKQLAKKQWFADEIPEGSKSVKLRPYVDEKGGHTELFLTEVNKFKDCKKAMISRGKIETLYASYYYKLWGRTMPKGYWFLCTP